MRDVSLSRKASRMLSSRRGMFSSEGGMLIPAVRMMVADVRQFFTAGMAISAAFSLWGELD